MTASERSSSIRYIRPRIPAFDLPAYPGSWHEVLVPDTLDLQDRAELAVNGLTGPTDPQADYEIYWHADPHGDRLMMEHDHNDHVQPKFHEALPLMRLMCGSDLGQVVERRWMEVLLHMRGPDGLLYYPVEGRPWIRRHAIGEQFGPLPEADHYAQPYSNGRLLAAVALHYLLTGDRVWLELGQGMVDGLTRTAVHRGDWAYFPTMQLGPDQRVDPEAGPPPPWVAMINAWPAMGLAQFCRATGYEPAAELSGRLARYLCRHAGTFGPDAGFLPEEPANPATSERAHLHGHTYQLLAILEYALLAGDRDLGDFALSGYRYAGRHGDACTGFFPEWIDRARRQNGEICGVADMVALAVKLSAGGVADCWDDADRWVRNHLVEGQLRRCDWWYRLGVGQPRLPVDPQYQTDDRVGERNLGAFAAQPPPNDFGRHIAHCCTGNGARSLYYAWEHAVRREGEALRVNLLLNRASPWAEVDSYLPYEGRVAVHCRQGAVVSVRLPEWVQPHEVTGDVGGEARGPRCEGRYACLGPVRAGETATLRFPVFERAHSVSIEKVQYTVVRRGNEVVRMEPAGTAAPFYQRDHYRQDEVRWRRRRRFVAEPSVPW
jgi:hypothetical protein